MDARTIHLTDAPLPKDGACPVCKAPTDARVIKAGFGPVVEACVRCGHEFQEAA